MGEPALIRQQIFGITFTIIFIVVMVIYLASILFDLRCSISCRGGGFISLENLLYFARNFQKSFQDLLRKHVGDRSVWYYPFVVAGINLTFMLIQMLDLEAGTMLTYLVMIVIVACY
ncbi:unnamed protein product [Cochlearia groenlandica]